MFMNFNNVTVMGRLAADPEFTKGTKEDGSDDRCWARLAVNRPTKDGAADFVPICAWGPRARVLSDYGKKGKVVLVMGSLRTNNKQRPDGSYDNYTEVSVGQIVLGPDAKGKGAPVAADSADAPIPTAAIPSMTPEVAALLQAQLAPLLAAQAAEGSSDDPFNAQA
jgi:single-strand DNA-binding protein